MNMPENSGIRLYLSIVCAFLCIGYLMSGITNNHEPNYRGEMPIEAENVNLDTVEMEPVINVENIDTEVVDVQEEFDTSSDLEKIGDVSYSEAIKVEGMTFNLYPTFENDVDAVYGIKSQAPKLIKGMQDKYCLSVCTPENIQDYIDHYYEYLEYAYEQANGIIDKTLAREMVSFESFIDIYENDECNDEIERIIDDLGMADLEENVNNIIGNDKPSNSAGIVKVDKSIKDETIEEETKENIIKEQLEDTVNVLNDLYVMMPSNTGAAEAVEAIEEEIIEDLELLSGVDETKNYVGMNSVKRISYNKNSKFSISKGVSYATKHATSPNVKKYSACVRGGLH